MASTAPVSTPIPLAAWRVDCCCIADDVRLLFLYPPPGATDLDTFELSLRTPFVLDVKGQKHLLDPTGPRERLGPLLGVYGRAVAGAAVGRDGTFSLSFTNGATLIIEPDLVLEAWELAGPRGAKLVCLPGGDGTVSFDRQRATVG
jgi:hypothetical protein